MKIMNSKHIDQLIDIEEQELFEEENLSSSCWEAKIDRNTDSILFLIDNEVVLKTKLSKIKEEITVDKLSFYIKFLKENDIKGLEKEIRGSK